MNPDFPQNKYIKLQDGTFSCSICGKIFRINTSAAMHFKRTHLNDRRKDNERTEERRILKSLQKQAMKF